MKTINDIVDITSGFAFKSKDFKDNSDAGYPIIRIQNLNETTKEFKYWDLDFNEKYLVYENDILISLSGNVKLDVWKGPIGLLNQRIIKLSPKEGILKDWLFYLLKSIIKEIESLSKKSIISNISVKDFKKIKINVPNIKKQKRIVEMLNKISEINTKRQQQLKHLFALKRSIFIDTFGDPVTNEKEWPTDKLKELGLLARGKSKHRPRNAPELLNGPYPLIQTGDIPKGNLYIKSYNQTYSELGLKQSKLWPKDTLCITIAANIAHTGILTFDSCFPDSVVGFTPKNGISNIFISIWFSFLQNNLEKNAPQSAQKNINLAILNDLDVIVPPGSLQSEFDIKIKNIEKYIEKLHESEIQLGTLYDSISHLIFRDDDMQV